MASGVALQGGDEDLPGALLAGFHDPLLVLDDDRSGLLLQLGLQHLEQALGGFVAVQAAQLVERLPLEVEQLGQLLLAAVDVLDPLGELPLRLLDDLLLFPQLLGLLFEGVLALVERPLALVQLFAQGAEFTLALGLLLKAQLLQLQFHLAPAVFHVLLGALDDLARLGLRIPAAETVEHLHENERQPRRGGTDHDVENGLSDVTHNWYSRRSWPGECRRQGGVPAGPGGTGATVRSLTSERAPRRGLPHPAAVRPLQCPLGKARLRRRNS